MITPPLSIWLIEAGINYKATTCYEEPNVSRKAGKAMNIVGKTGSFWFLTASFFMSENFWYRHLFVENYMARTIMFNHSPRKVKEDWTMP